MPLSSAPTIVLVPGSFALQGMYAPFLDHLQFYGYEYVFADLPSIGVRAGLPPAAMSDDAAHIRGIIEQLFSHGKSAVLVAHSYGGIPATECLKGLTAKERGPGQPAVERVIYASAIIPPVGTSLHAMIGEPPRGAVEVLDNGYLKLVGKAASGARDFSSLPAEEQLEWAKYQDVHSAESFDGPLTHAGYKDVLVTYLIATQDQSLPPAVQQGYVQAMKNAGADVTVVEIATDHCWSASRPKSTAVKVIQAIGSSHR